MRALSAIAHSIKNMKCRFCSLVKKEDEFCLVYEDAKILAFMDKAPVNPGHILVIPKKHITSFEKIESKLFTYLMYKVQKLAKAIKKATKCKKVGLLIAGFDVDHTHVHLIPMNDIKDVATKRVWEEKQKIIQINELKKTANKIAQFI